MYQAIEIFVVGLVGVFIGMGLLYLAIRVLARVVDCISAGKGA